MVNFVHLCPFFPPPVSLHGGGYGWQQSGSAQRQDQPSLDADGDLQGWRTAWKMESLRCKTETFFVGFFSINIIFSNETWCLSIQNSDLNIEYREWSVKHRVFQHPETGELTDVIEIFPDSLEVDG